MSFHNDSPTLYELNKEELERQIPLMIYLVIICVTGIAGNALVCYVFARTDKRSTYRMFVTFLSAVDLFTCCLSLPLQFIVYVHKYNFDNKWLCKVTILMNTWTTLTSCFILLCIAFDRYRKVCRHFSWQVSLKVAKYMCLASVVCGLACSWLSAIIYGIRTEQHSLYNVTIKQCLVTNNMKETLLPLINNITFATVFVFVFIFTFSFYSRIALRIRQQMGWKNRHKDGLDVKDNGDNGIEMSTENSCETTDIESSRNNIMVNVEMSKGKKKEKSYSSKKRTLNYKTSKIMFMVSLAAIVSFTPVISLLLARSLDKTFVVSLNDSERKAYNFFLKSYFINSAINPLIYGLFDAKFRSLCKKQMPCYRR